MKVPKKGMLCGWCELPVVRHAQAVEEFVPDEREGSDGRLRKQLYHKRRCWSKELRHRLDTERLDSRLARAVELAKERVLNDPELQVRTGLPEEQLIEMAIRHVGADKPELVSEMAHLVVVGETDVDSGGELPEVEVVRDEEGQVENKVHVPRGQLQLAVRTAIEARGGAWWTREQIREDVRALGIETTDEAIDNGIFNFSKKAPVERRAMASGGAREFRVIAASMPPVPPMLDTPSEKVERQVTERHSTRPTFWEKQAAAAVSMKADELAAATQSVAQQEPTMANGNGKVDTDWEERAHLLEDEVARLRTQVASLQEKQTSVAAILRIMKIALNEVTG